MDRNVKKDLRILIIFGRNICETTAIKYVFQFLPHPTSAFALPGEIRLSIIRVKMNEKTSINSIYPNLRAPTAGPSQDFDCRAAMFLPNKVQECL